MVSHRWRGGTTPARAKRFRSSLSNAGTTNDPFRQIYLGSLGKFVGVSNEVAVATTAHALVTTGISGTLQAGDLLVACITSRIASTTSVTLPTGGEWTLVSEQKNNNTATNTTAAASGLMAYCVRGASNPNLTFTHPVAPSQAQGRIVAYRNVNTTSPKDTQTSFTTATAITAVSGTGLTTTQIEDLIVAMACGGQEAAWSAFNATDPAGASGATVTTAPTTTWSERADSAVTTGADGSLAIFDAVKLTSGATGNFTATASVSAGHVVIAGAFKITARIADAWNVEDKSANITLSNSDKTAITSSATAAGVRSTQSNLLGPTGTGKYYSEFLVSTVGSGNVGLNTSTATVTNAVPASYVNFVTGNIIVGGAGSGYSLGAIASNDIIGLALDAATKKIWFRKNSGLWNNDASADPITGTNGVTTSFANDIAVKLWVNPAASGVDVTLRTESAEFTYYGPVGFTSWMGEALPAAPAGDGVGDADGTSTAAATGAAIATANASTAGGTGTASATGTGIKSADASTAAGIGAAAATGSSITILEGVGTAAGIGSASATGVAIDAGTGTAAGIGAASATGVAIGAGAGLPQAPARRMRRAAQPRLWSRRRDERRHGRGERGWHRRHALCGHCGGYEHRGRHRARDRSICGYCGRHRRGGGGGRDCWCRRGHCQRYSRSDRHGIVDGGGNRHRYCDRGRKHHGREHCRRRRHRASYKRRQRHRARHWRGHWLSRRNRSGGGNGHRDGRQRRHGSGHRLRHCAV